jgi:hypothetical protein
MELLKHGSLGEIYWFSRIVLKDLSCHLSYQSVLKRYHPDAVGVFDTHGDLRKLLAELTDPKVCVCGHLCVLCIFFAIFFEFYVI